MQEEEGEEEEEEGEEEEEEEEEGEEEEEEGEEGEGEDDSPYEPFRASSEVLTHTRLVCLWQ